MIGLIESLLHGNEPPVSNTAQWTGSLELTVTGETELRKHRLSAELITVSFAVATSLSYFSFESMMGNVCGMVLCVNCSLRVERPAVL